MLEYLQFYVVLKVDKNIVQKLDEDIFMEIHQIYRR